MIQDHISTNLTTNDLLVNSPEIPSKTPLKKDVRSSSVLLNATFGKILIPYSVCDNLFSNWKWNAEKGKRHFPFTFNSLVIDWDLNLQKNFLLQKQAQKTDFNKWIFFQAVTHSMFWVKDTVGSPKKENIHIYYSSLKTPAW